LSPAVAELLYGLDWMAGAPPGFDGPEADDLPDDLKLTAPVVYWMGDDDWDRDDPDDMPDLVPVEGGLPLLYHGKSHLVFGAGGTGKTWFVLYCIAARTRRAGGAAGLARRSSRGSLVRRDGTTCRPTRPGTVVMSSDTPSPWSPRWPDQRWEATAPGHRR
jgi:hypothetical protein